jgi:hypothetical protein
MTDYTDLDNAIRQGSATEWVPRWALELLRDIASGRRELTAVRHPLGFLCLPVQRRGEHGICVHMWTPALRPAVQTSQMHSHSWDLTSYVLYGTLHNQHIRVAETPGSATHRVFEVRSHGDVDELHATDRLVSCDPEPASAHGGGCVYLLPAGEFHRTEVPGGQHVATVVLGRTRPAAADLSLGPLGTRSHTLIRSHCDRGETVQAALLIAERLEAAGVA